MFQRHASLVAILALAAGAAGCPAEDPGVAEGDGTAPADPAAEEGGDAGGLRHMEDTGIVQCADGDGFDANGQLFWGELHLHTTYSLDAWNWGTETTPTRAYLYANDPNHTWVPGVPPIDRPLDFVAVTDHAEFLSVTEGCVQDTANPYYDDWFPGADNDCFNVRNGRHTFSIANLGDLVWNICANVGITACQTEEEGAWDKMIDAANQANLSCHFTALVGYEFSSVIDDTGTVPVEDYTNHRNVIFGPNPNRYPDAPFHAGSLQPTRPATPLDLWQDLETSCGGAECNAVTIPHNSNQSNGLSLKVWGTTYDDVALQEEYQVSAEIFQHKGASECPVSALDPDCDFEQLDPAAPNASYIRPQLGEGMVWVAQGGAADPRHLINPLKLGFVAATDGHNGAPGNVVESTWNGHESADDDTPNERLTGERLLFNPGGLTGVWAQQNTRADIFDAIKNRETFGTTGPRIEVRVQRFDNPPPVCAFVPGVGQMMGGTWEPTSAPNAAHFQIHVRPDQQDQLLPSGSMGLVAIQHVQVVRVQADGTGVQSEVVWNVPMGTGLLGNVFPTGDCTVVTDASFDPALHTFWYVRVLQEETLRWSHDDCKADPPDTGIDPRCANTPDWVQERAWTSPIWYVPPP